MKETVQRGFTIVELLVVIAILVVLAGIVYAATGPSREKARQTVCMSNLSQIGQALTIYRSDYEGGTNSATNNDFHTTLATYGLPPDVFALLGYLRNQEVLHCPNVSPSKAAEWRRRNAGGPWTDYGLGIWPEPLSGQFPVLAEALKQRGEDFVYLTCPNHDFPPPDRPVPSRFMILLRINGSVAAHYYPNKEPFWKW